MNLMSVLNKEVVDRRNRQSLMGGTTAASRLLRAKSGKSADTSTSPARTSLGEAMAVDKGQEQVNQVQRQSDLATMKQRGQIGAQDQQKAMHDQELQSQKDRADVEQRVTENALANKKYMDQLDRVGTMQLTKQGKINQLMVADTQLGNSREFLKQVLGDDLLIGKEQVDYAVIEKEIAAGWEAQFEQWENESAQYAQQTEAIGKVVEGGANVYTAKEKKDKG